MSPGTLLPLAIISLAVVVSCSETAAPVATPAPGFRATFGTLYQEASRANGSAPSYDSNVIVAFLPDAEMRKRASFYFILRSDAVGTYGIGEADKNGDQLVAAYTYMTQGDTLCYCYKTPVNPQRVGTLRILESDPVHFSGLFDAVLYREGDPSRMDSIVVKNGEFNVERK